MLISGPEKSVPHTIQDKPEIYLVSPLTLLQSVKKIIIFVARQTGPEFNPDIFKIIEKNKVRKVGILEQV